MDTNYSLSDLKAVVDGQDGTFGGSFGWIILIFLFFLGFGNGGFWGGNRVGALPDIQEFQTQKDVLSSGFTTQKEILEYRYTTQLGFQNLGSQMANCCCSIEKAIANEGAATRQLIQDVNIQELRDRLATANQALATQTIVNNVVDQIKPCPRPAWLTCSPYQSYNPVTYFGGYNGAGCCGGNSVL